MSNTVIKLRALEPEDIKFLFDLENDTNLWHLSHTQQPFSMDLLKRYIQEADRDIYEARQFRFAIEKTNTKTLLGFVDLFDFDPKNKRAGVGIIIKNANDRNKGFGQIALQEICNYAYNVLYLHQLFANISASNKASIRLFEKLGFVQVGCKKDWNFNGNDFEDELLFQHINKN